MASEIVAMIQAVLPAGAGHRLALIGSVNNRLGQRWASGEIEPPADIEAFVHDQFAKLKNHGDPRPAIGELISDMRAAGLDDVVIASFLAEAIEILARDR